MGTNYGLVRARRPLDGDVSFAADAEGGVVHDEPFGTMDEVLARLRPLAESEWRMSDDQRAEMSRSLQAMGLGAAPESVHLRVVRDGRSLSLTVMGDPVTSLAIDHAAPWDLLPFIEVFADKGPFAIEDAARGVYLDPAGLAPRSARPAEAPFERASLGDVAVTRGPERLRPLFRLAPRAPSGFHQAQVIDARDVLFVVAGHGVTCLDPSTGAPTWTVAHGRGRRYGAAGHGLFLVGSDHPSIGAHGATTGQVAFDRRAPGRLLHEPLVHRRGFLLGTEAGALVDVSPAGDLRVLHRARGAFFGAPVLLDDERAAAATSEGEILVVSLATGELLGRVELPSVRINERTTGPASVFSLAAHDGALFARLEDGVARLGADLRVQAIAGAPRGGDGSLVVVGAQLFTPFSWSEGAGYLTGQLALSPDLEVTRTVHYTGEGNLGSPVRVGGALAFADLAPGRVDVDVVREGGEEIASATLPCRAPGWPRLSAHHGRVVVACPDAIVAFELAAE
ncbi:MAG: PQQ-binding-like beta-propeller repeat protein [Myxococcales bacterium]|nr:PQQ-binding-like beta-propeller repeat protein [Myxococcales bacterium]